MELLKMNLTNGNYRLLELDEKRKQARICSASKEEIQAHNYPEWTFEERSDLNTNLVDIILKERAKKKGYKIVPIDAE